MPNAKPIKYDDATVALSGATEVDEEYAHGDELFVLARGHVKALNFPGGDSITRKHTFKADVIRILAEDVGRDTMALVGEDPDSGRLLSADGERRLAARLALAERLSSPMGADELEGLEESVLLQAVGATAAFAEIDIDELFDDLAKYWDAYEDVMTKAAANALAGVEYARRRRGRVLDERAEERIAASADQANADEDGNVPVPSELDDKPKLTKPMVAALELVIAEAEDGRTFRLSNKTELRDSGDLTVYWQTTNRLVSAGLAAQKGGGDMYELTDAGVAAGSPS